MKICCKDLYKAKLILTSDVNNPITLCGMPLLFCPFCGVKINKKEPEWEAP